MQILIQITPELIIFQVYVIQEVIIKVMDTTAWSVRIRSNSGPCFPVFGLNIDQNKSEYEHFLHCVQRPKLSLHEIT